MEYNTDKFKSGLSDLRIELTEKQIDEFLTYYEMLVEKNKVMNLTAITEFDEVIEKHFLDSLSLIKVKDLHNRTNVLDLGTGADFPGIPLKIAFPELNITLMDSLNKRILFLQDVINELGLTDIEAIHGRAEEAARNKKYREKYDLCVSRAVANISTLSEYCLPFVKVGGEFISYKSGNIDEELDAAKKGIKILGGTITDVHKFDLGENKQGRSFVIIDKNQSTPKTYPRKAGTPSKNPL
ncbi:MAG: 16S rRNA (guanine(527)-N(7))-methyltransferase RsmG [Lachnospiraceae bacterium]|nr:16S rRNA (guanine(527)-N(7))-methyltransferase RsmG [Lachnospiraceae bacterium]